MAYLNNHMRVHTIKRSNKCDKCNKHKCIHTIKRFYKCDKTFSKIFNLNRHKYIHIPERLKPYKCNICNKSFSSNR